MVNVCASSNIAQIELKEILQEAQKVSQDGVDAIPGLTIDESFGESISVIIIATGLRRFDLGDFQKPRIFTTTSQLNQPDNPYTDIDSLKKINIQDTLRRFKN